MMIPPGFDEANRKRREDTLQLKHLALYLPYGLKMTFEGDDNEHEMIGIGLGGVKLVSPFNDYGSAKFEDAKPLLHPLSRLTEPILEGGIIPILELEKIMTQNVGGKRKGIEYDAEHNVARIIYEHSPHPMVDPETQISTSFFEIDTDSEDITFSVVTEHPKFGDTYFLTGNEFKMYQKLYEWHFDVFGLIEKGQALEKPIKE